jgi:hemoglobin-like flavoprotein
MLRTMPTDATLMEASLIALADSGVEIRHALFDRFFATFPDRRATFYNLDASSRRMADETIQMMFGLATEQSWVWPLVAELVFTHRSYGPLPMGEYDAFIDMTVDALDKAAGGGWSADCDAAWRRQAKRLKAMIDQARSEWMQVMPGASTKSS